VTHNHRNKTRITQALKRKLGHPVAECSNIWLEQLLQALRLVPLEL
jgi:hypothetical protein